MASCRSSRERSARLLTLPARCHGLAVLAVVPDPDGSGAGGRVARERSLSPAPPRCWRRAGRSSIWGADLRGLPGLRGATSCCAQRGRDIHRRDRLVVAASPPLVGPLWTHHLRGEADPCSRAGARRACSWRCPSCRTAPSREPARRPGRARGVPRPRSRSTRAGCRWPPCSAPPPPGSGGPARRQRAGRHRRARRAAGRSRDRRVGRLVRHGRRAATRPPSCGR